MKIKDFYGRGRAVLSFEIFPPKKEGTLDSVFPTIERLQVLKPDFIGVTCGAGGTGGRNLTVPLAAAIREKCGIESMAHVTCMSSGPADVDRIMDDLRASGVHNIMALRGDRNPDLEQKHDFRYANELVSYIREHGDFGVCAACYPETHFEAPDSATDLRNLKHKVDCGAEVLISQLFFDNDHFLEFRENARREGINVPISAGIMPVTNKKQIERMVTMCGASLPAKLVKMLQKYEGDPVALTDAGIAYAVAQIADLLTEDVDGIHIYTLNKPDIAGKITESIRSLL